MKVVGITGGIGSGKSTVCSIFEALGVPVYYADDRAKALMVEDAGLTEAVRAAFGEAAYVNGVLDRAYLAAQVFNSPERLARLNALVHPAVAHDFMRWVTANAHHPYLIKEAAILFESGAYKAVQETVLVTALEEVRIQRVMQRDRVTESEVRRRMTNQWSEERKAALAHHILVNDGHHLLVPQVLDLHRRFLG